MPASAPSRALVAAAARITGTKKPSPMPSPGRPYARRSANTPPYARADAMSRRCGIEIACHQSRNGGTATFQLASGLDASRPTMDLGLPFADREAHGRPDGKSLPRMRPLRDHPARLHRRRERLRDPADGAVSLPDRALGSRKRLARHLGNDAARRRLTGARVADGDRDGRRRDPVRDHAELGRPRREAGTRKRELRR